MFKKKLKDLTLTVGASKPTKAFTYLDLSAVDSKLKAIASPSRIEVKDAPSRARQILMTGDVLVSTVRPNLNSVAILESTYKDAIGSTGFCVLRADASQLHNRYLFHWVRSMEFVNEMTRLATGASYPAISDAVVKNSQIPLPSLDEQIRIAKILDAADELRAKRRQNIELLDELARSLYSEMVSETNTTEAPLGQLCSIAGEYGLGASSVAYSEDKPRYVRITDVNESGELNTVKVSPAGTAVDWEKYLLEPGDLLFARSGATVGKAYLHGSETEPHVFAGYLIRFRVRPELILPEVLWAFTKTERYDRWVLGIQRTVAQPNINAKQYGQELLVPVPSMELQIKFSDFIHSLWAIRKQINFQLSLFDEMYVSLQDRAFKGEL